MLLRQLNGLFPMPGKGERIYMDHTPGPGATLMLNDGFRGQTPGDVFFSTLPRVRFDERPADPTLKHNLPGE